jgi:signal transduction histidine kinase
MSACMQVMNDITQQMRARYPSVKGGFVTQDLALSLSGRTVGRVRIGHFGPYFFNENDFYFLDALNTVLIGSGVFSLILAATVGWFLARHVSAPIRKTVGVAKQMSAGNYVVRIEDKSTTRELDELMLAVNQLARSLGKQEGLRRQLTADVAHELRTPLTTIGTHIEAMMEGVWQPTPERLSSCYEEIERLGKLVRDLESLARVESDNLKLDKAPVSLLELANKTVRNFEAEIAEKGLTVSVVGNCPEVLADRDRIQQVLINLLSNAVKYTPPAGPYAPCSRRRTPPCSWSWRTTASASRRRSFRSFSSGSTAPTSRATARPEGRASGWPSCAPS